ncbi:MAG: hypothetical protein WDA26_07515 [Pusillimonas sp.]
MTENVINITILIIFELFFLILFLIELVKAFKRIKTITQTPTSPVSLLTKFNPGDMVEIKAYIKDPKIIASPYFKRPCLFYYAREFKVVTEGNGKGKNQHEETGEELYSENLLTLVDKSGSIKVDLKDFEYKDFCQYKKKLLYRDSSRLFGYGSKIERYREEYILPPTSQMIYVLGKFNRSPDEEFITGNKDDKRKSVFSTKSEETVLRETWFRIITCFIIWFSLSLFMYYILIIIMRG